MIMDTINLCWVSTYSFPENNYVDFHSHNEIEIIIYTKGKGITTISDTKHEFNANSIVVINPNTPHDELCIEPCENILIRFTSGNFNISTGVYRLNKTIVFEQILKQIRNEITYPSLAYRDLINLKIEEFKILLMREIFSQKYDSQMSNCYQYLQENCCLRLDVKEIAFDFGFSYETFRHKFKKLYGLSPTDFIILQRLQKSYNLLENTNKSCIEIASECGFSDTHQFSKFFKRQFGYSPNTLRKNIVPHIQKSKESLFKKNYDN